MKKYNDKFKYTEALSSLLALKQNDHKKFQLKNYTAPSCNFPYMLWEYFQRILCLGIQQPMLKTDHNYFLPEDRFVMSGIGHEYYVYDN
jgi:hypothetical protein